MGSERTSFRIRGATCLISLTYDPEKRDLRWALLLCNWWRPRQSDVPNHYHLGFGLISPIRVLIMATRLILVAPSDIAE